jgi:hypothetical protein
MFASFVSEPNGNYENFTNPPNNVGVLTEQYRELTMALGQLEKDEHTVWNDLGTAKDPQFPAKQQNFQIQQKMNKLRNDRNIVFNKLLKDYDSTHNYKDSVFKLKARNTYINSLLQANSDSNKGKLSNLNQDILTKRRQSEINTNSYYRQLNTIYYLKLSILFTILALIPIILALNDVLLKKSTGSFCVLIIFIIYILFVIIRSVDNSNRSRLLWQERIFSKRSAPSSSPPSACVTPQPAPLGGCVSTKYGCCPNGLTPKTWANDPCNSDSNNTQHSCFK